MDKIEKLKKDYKLDRSTLDNIRWLKEEEMGKLTKQEQNELNSIYKQMKEKENLLYSAIDNIPEQFTDIKKEIKNSVDTYLENIEDVNSYFQGKYFKEGVGFGINMILEAEKMR